jgi:membrane protease YdiL (CAAX protease family)
MVDLRLSDYCRYLGMNVFVNEIEGRLRAGWRLLAQIILAIVIVIPLGLLVRGLGFDSDYVGLFASASGIVLSIVLVGRFIDKRAFSEFGLQTTEGWKQELWVGTLTGIVAMSGIWLFQWVFGYIRMDGFGWDRPSDQFWLMPIIGNMLLMMLVGFYEEYWTRGYQMKVLAEGMHFGPISPRFAVAIAMVLTSILFGVLHAGNPNASMLSTVNISLAGIMLAMPYVLTGRLWVSIGLHFSWNFFQGAIFGFPVSGKTFRTAVVQTVQDGPDWFTGGAFGPEAGAIGLVAMTIITVWIYVRFRPQSIDEHVNHMITPPHAM